ncbi:MAG: class II aldolase/adducin family protein [Clostridiales bacterium]|nr:class II aldolase/adducin family protein [Clostridiales bacterium]
MDESRSRQDIVEIGKRLYNKGFVASNDGNISIRLSEREILITPTGVSKGYMSGSDMLKVDLEGNVISGFLKPTSEMKMHLAVYRKRSDVNAIVHAHPPKATAFAVAGIKFDKITLPEVVFSLGYISLTEYGTPTTHEVPRSIEKHIDNSDALLLANHGALTVGKDIYDAYYKMETLEHFSAISLYARLLGGERSLNEKQTEELYRVRREVYGKSNPNCTGCGACAKGVCKTGANTSAKTAQVCDEYGAGNVRSESKTQSENDLRESIKRVVLAELLKMQN